MKNQQLQSCVARTSESPASLVSPLVSDHRAGSGVARGFTLIELLIVIAIIGILASMLVPVLARVKLSSQVAQSRVEMKAIESALAAYYGAYSRYPVPTNSITDDFTFGTPTIGSTVNGYRADNAALMPVLMAEDRLVNAGNVLNPQKTAFLQGVKRAAFPMGPGLGSDCVFRDPWGNPYIITINYSYSQKCRDAFYSLASVSAQSSGSEAGLNGLFRTPPDTNFVLSAPVMIWSLGRDGAADASTQANAGFNKDNILNWAK